MTVRSYRLAQHAHLVLQSVQQLDIVAITGSEGRQDSDIGLDGPQQLVHVTPLANAEFEHQHLQLLFGTKRDPSGACQSAQDVSQTTGFNLKIKHGEGQSDFGIIGTWVGAYFIMGAEQLTEQTFHHCLATIPSDSDDQRFLAAQKYTR